MRQHHEAASQIGTKKSTRKNKKMTTTVTYPLNFLEYGYVAFEGLMRTMPQVYLLRLQRSFDAAQVQAVTRELVSANPRLRALVDPTLWQHRLLVLPEGPVLQQLWEDAWEVHAHLDAADRRAMEALHERLHNLVMPIERGLMCKFVYVPHTQEPVLFICVHHIVGDGRTMLHYVTEVCKRLAGGPPMALQPVEAPPLSQALGPARWWQYPAAVWRSLRHEKQQQRTIDSLEVVRLEQQGSPFLSTHALKHYQVPVPASVLRQVARKLDVSLNGLVVMAMAETFLRIVQHAPGRAAVIRQAMDIRHLYPKAKGHGPLWGNHVGVFHLIETGAKTWQERAQSVRAQVDEHVRRYADREVFGRYAFMPAATWLGRQMLSFMATRMVRRSRLPQLSCYATNIGSLDRILPVEARGVLKDMTATVPSPTFLQVVSEINDVVSMTASWQRSEFSKEDLNIYLSELSQTFIQLAQLI